MMVTGSQDHPPSRLAQPLPCLLLGLGTAYLYYYWSCACKRPRLVSGSAFRQFLKTRCPVVKDTYWPTIWCFEGHLQTIIRVFLVSKPQVSYRSEVISTADGGQISLDWVDNDESTRFPDRSSRPTIVFLPGLTGNSRQSYILHLVRRASQDGYRSVVFNNRGFGSEKLLTPRTFCAANTEDLSRVITHVQRLAPDAPMVAVGVSLGGMTLLNYLAAAGTASPLCAALTISSPWNVFVSTESLEKPLNYLLFNRTLTRGLRDTVEKYRKVIAQALDVNYVLQSRTIREFDERYTSVVFGFPTCDDYYRAASPYTKLSEIQTPVLCLNAADDPFSPNHAIPVDRASGHLNVALLITSRGGHIGFLEGIFPIRQSYMDRIFSQFTRAVLLQK